MSLPIDRNQAINILTEVAELITSNHPLEWTPVAISPGMPTMSVGIETISLATGLAAVLPNGVPFISIGPVFMYGPLIYSPAENDSLATPTVMANNLSKAITNIWLGTSLEKLKKGSNSGLEFITALGVASPNGRT